MEFFRIIKVKTQDKTIQDELTIKNLEFISSENYLVNISEHYSALNLMVFAAELKLLIFKISARTFLKNFSFRKELKLFAASCK